MEMNQFPADSILDKSILRIWFLETDSILGNQTAPYINLSFSSMGLKLNKETMETLQIALEQSSSTCKPWKKGIRSHELSSSDSPNWSIIKLIALFAWAYQPESAGHLAVFLSYNKSALAWVAAAETISRTTHIRV
jgi:hypothetical protein